MTITTFGLTSPFSSSAAPFTVGLGFAEGEVPSTFTTGLEHYQVVVKRRWNDGSIKHAIVSGRAPLEANKKLSVTVSQGAPASAQSLTVADIVAAAPTAIYKFGDLGTVDLSTLLSAAPFRTWLSGPEAIECHYRGEVAGTALAAWFHVRLYASGDTQVTVVGENGYVDDGKGAVAIKADAKYIPTITVGGKVVYDNGGAVLTHCKTARVVATGWIGNDPQIVFDDVAHLQASKLVPNYPLSAPNDATLNSLVQTYSPMKQGAVAFAMASPGANSSIALLPSWVGNYLGSADRRAYNAVIASSLSMNSFGLCQRDFTTKDVIKPTDFSTWSIYGPQQGGDRGVNLSNGSAWEINHHPGECYPAYLITGDYIHYETMLMQVATMWLVRGSTFYQPSGPALTFNGTSRIIQHETRGTAWALRSMSQLAAISPDGDSIAAEYQEVLASNYKYWESVTQRPGINHLGYLYEYGANGGLDESVYGIGKNPPWQQHWWMSVNGFASDLQPLKDMSSLIKVRDWMYKGIVGILGPLEGFLYSAASTYTAKISDTSSLDPTTWYKEWHQVAVETFKDAPGGYAAIKDPGLLSNVGTATDTFPMPPSGQSGDPSQATYGRWGYLLPAIAYAKDHKALGAEEAWNRIASASNYSVLVKCGFDQSPQWAVFPRDVKGEVIVATTPVVYKGVLASSLTSTGQDGASPLFKSITPSDAGKYLWAELVTPPAGDFKFYLDGSFSYTGVNGSFIWKKWANDVDMGNSTVYLKDAASQVVPPPVGMPPVVTPPVIVTPPAQPVNANFTVTLPATTGATGYKITMNDGTVLEQTLPSTGKPMRIRVIIEEAV